VTVRAVYPGSFDPPTIAHLAVAQAARRAGAVHVDFALSRHALGKDGHAWALEHRQAALVRALAVNAGLGVVVTDAQLIVDIAAGYDAVVMGADKWVQVRDPAWYGGSLAARDRALARLPRVLVAPRPGFDVVGAEVLALDAAYADVSSSAARAGRSEYLLPGVPGTDLSTTAAPAGDPAPRARERLIVDAMNVIGSRPDGWWRDRDGAARRLVATLAARSRRTGERIAVVLDGRPLPDLPEGVHGGVLVAYARRGGRDAADDRIVEEVARDRDPGSLVVVTSDRELARRVGALGARVAGVRRVLDDE
jgi:predicted RNA-binding protein with PIN domain